MENSHKINNFNSSLLQNINQNISSIAPGSSKIFYLPFQDNEDKYIRTGTIGDGSCLIHALMHAYSPDYVSMSEPKKIEVVKKIRASLVKSLDKDKWKELNKGIISIVGFQEFFLKITTSFYSCISKSPSITKHMKHIFDKLYTTSNSKEVYCSLVELVNLKTLTSFYESSYCDRIVDYRKKILEVCELRLESVTGMVRVEVIISEPSARMRD
jgi:hypothetical protein